MYILQAVQSPMAKTPLSDLTNKKSTTRSAKAANQPQKAKSQSKISLKKVKEELQNKFKQQ